MKKILGFLAVVAMLAALIFAIVYFKGSVDEQICTGIQVQIMDNEADNYVSESEVLKIMHLNNLDLVGSSIKQIKFRRIERVVSELKMVRHVESFSTNAYKVVVRIWQYQPVLRVLDERGSYYINSDGKQIGLSYHSAANVLIASGFHLDSVQVSRLYRMALLLKKDAFWDAQIEQVYVEQNGEWTLIPRVGKQEILLGLPIDIENKLSRLKLFYLKALPKVGWERYARINLKYQNQIVCTLKDK